MAMNPRVQVRSGVRALALLSTSILITVCGGDGGTGESNCDVTAVAVQPNPVTLTLGASTTLTATVTSSNCNPAPVVTWSSSNPAQVSLLPNGNQVQVTGDALTTVRAGLAGLLAPVTITATAGSPAQSGTSQITVEPAPAIGLNPTALSFNAVEGGADPTAQTVTISNAGGGLLTGLGVGTITYGAGATGWLAAPQLSSATASPTANLNIQPVTGALGPGTYTATVPVTSTAASNSPQNVTVSFTVVSSTPVIGLSSLALTFNATEGGADPASQAVTITNVGSGTLSGLAIGTITYGAGATGWLQAPGLSSTTADPSAILTIQPVTGSLTPGVYTATVPVTSGVASNSPQDLSVTFIIASPLSVIPFLGSNQQGLAGFALNIRPAVLVRSAGVPAPNVSVTFQAITGGGSVTGATVNTNASGVAQVGSWILGAAPGANTMTATVAGAGVAGNPVTFAATGQAGTFNITIQNVGPAFTAPVQAAFDAATTKWQQIIYQDITDIPNFQVNANQCGAGSPALGPVTIDDVRIFARIDSIDGPSGILGSAGPCFIRNSSGLTVLGAMTFDSADVAGLVAAGVLNSVILHEMGHVLGFGTLWTQPQFGCLQNASNPPGTILDTHFNCPSALVMFDSIGGTSYTGGNKVPVENCGPASPASCGPGNVNSHWREPTFFNELMTGYLNGGIANPLSRLSAAAMEDLGYGVNYSGSDVYLQVFSLMAGPSRSASTYLDDDIYRGPIGVVDRNGRVVRVIPPR
jgi:hypothetical protein